MLTISRPGHFTVHGYTLIHSSEAAKSLNMMTGTWGICSTQSLAQQWKPKRGSTHCRTVSKWITHCHVAPRADRQLPRTLQVGTASMPKMHDTKAGMHVSPALHSSTTWPPTAKWSDG